MEGISWGRGWERSRELKQGPRASEETQRNPPEREADRCQWGEGRKPRLCLRLCSLALYTVHPHPRGAGKKGRHQAERAPTNGTGDRWTRDALRRQGDKALNNTKQNNNNNNNKKKKRKKIRVSHCSDSRIGPHIGGRWERRETRRQGGTGPLLHPRAGGFPF